MDAIRRFAEHVSRTRFDDLPPAVVAAARTFILDTYGVGMAGSAGPWVAELIASNHAWGSGNDARVWADGTRLPAPAAAMCNAYQIHNTEFDCLHERAVVHAVTVVLAAATAVAEREGGIGGRMLATAVVLGVDVAAGLGIGARSSLKFFRPATAGAFGATAAVGKLLGLDTHQLVNAFGITLGQLCGTMQAHTEGSMLLGMQAGFNARNAVVSCDMARRGLAGPQNVLEGPFGYYRLFEGDYDLGAVVDALGRTWRMSELAHKPFPSGRATHGIVDAVLTLQRAHRFGAGEIERIAARIPPLVNHLVGRPPHDAMEVNYARLCAAYVSARALIGGTVGIEDFRPDALRDAPTLALARRVSIEVDGNPDPNALTPIEVAITLRSGAVHTQRLDVVYGNPAKPLDREAHLGKFRRNWQAAVRPVPMSQSERLIGMVDTIEDVSDVREIVDCLCPG